ncbi:hypothetical protein ACE6H2_015273 [Prunus campanulata]
MVVGAAEYVICIGCKSPDTVLSEDNCLLRCEKCGAVQSVAPVQQRSPFDPTEKKKKKKQKKQKKQERVGGDEEGIVLKTPDFAWPVSMQGYALQMFHSG